MPSPSYHLTQLVTGPPPTTDAGTARVSLTPSAFESFVYLDSGTERIVLTPSALLAYATADSATEYLKLTVSGHDCYAIGTPEYDVTLMKRWNMGTPFARWEVGSLNNRWNTFVIGTGFDIPC